MPTQVTLLTVLLSSPSDVADERLMLASVIQELNNTWAAALSIQLQLLHWQTHSHPGVGPDAQALINQQLGDDYDLFIGIMWTRFGTPTGRAGSGTEEEFNRALARARQSGRVKVLFYFKNDPMPPSDIDPNELVRVAALKLRLRELGILYSEFRGNFADHVRIHLSRELLEIARCGSIPLPPYSDRLHDVEHRVSTLPTDQTETPGVFDGIASFLQHLNNSSAARKRMAIAIQRLGDAFTRRAAELNRAKETGDVTLELLQQSADAVAIDMEHFASAIEAELATLDDEFRAAVRSFSYAMPHLPWMGSGGKKQLNDMREFLPGFLQQLESANDSSRGFREQMASTPPLTTAHGRARRRALEAMDRHVTQQTEQAALVRELIESLPPEPSSA